MQIMIFNIPIGDAGNALAEMNVFLRGHKVLEVEKQFIGAGNGAYWSFCFKSVGQDGSGMRNGVRLSPA